MAPQTDKDKQKFQSYLDNIQAKTGKTPEDFRKLAAKKGPLKAREFLAWLKADYGLGYGHAGALWYLIGRAEDAKASPTEKLDKLFTGNKAGWRKAYDALEAKVRKFGADVVIAPNLSYINLRRGEKKFGIVQVSSAERLEIGIKRKGVAATARFTASGAWNPMVTHRVMITDTKQIDKDVLAWLKEAYKAAS